MERGVSRCVPWGGKPAHAVHSTVRARSPWQLSSLNNSINVVESLRVPHWPLQNPLDTWLFLTSLQSSCNMVTGAVPAVAFPRPRDRTEWSPQHGSEAVPTGAGKWEGLGGQHCPLLLEKFSRGCRKSVYCTAVLPAPCRRRLGTSFLFPVHICVFQ